MKSVLIQQINQNPQAPAVLRVISQVQQAGYAAYLVGGGVRDMILGDTPKDFDVATNAHPDVLQNLFSDTLLVGAKFGVVLVKVDGIAIEVTTFRKEGEYHDRRRPDLVQFSTIDQDAGRRDFTCNAIYFDPINGEIVDYFNGVKDIQQRIIRTVGPATERFSEDALRIIRAIRFASNLGFTIHKDTWTSLQELSHYLSEISIERVAGEFLKGFCGNNPARFFSLLDESGILQQFIPALTTLKGCEQPPEFHPEGDVFTHVTLMLQQIKPCPPAELVLAVLFHDIGKPATQLFEGNRIRFNGHDKIGADMTEIILRQLKLSNQLIDSVAFIVRRHMQFINIPSMKQSTLKKFLSSSLIEYELELHRLDCLASNGDLSTYHYALDTLQQLRQTASEVILPPPILTGRDLIKAGLQPGPCFSKILEAVYNEQLEGKVGNQNEALALALEINAHPQ